MQMMGGQLDASFFERPEMKQQVLDQLINERVLIDANKKLGISVTDERIKHEILAIPAFQKDGKFDPDTYRMLLADAEHVAALVRRARAPESRRCANCRSRSARQC